MFSTTVPIWSPRRAARAAGQAAAVGRGGGRGGHCPRPIFPGLLIPLVLQDPGAHATARPSGRKDPHSAHRPHAWAPGQPARLRGSKCLLSTFRAARPLPGCPCGCPRPQGRPRPPPRAGLPLRMGGTRPPPPHALPAPPSPWDRAAWDDASKVSWGPWGCGATAVLSGCHWLPRGDHSPFTKRWKSS